MGSDKQHIEFETFEDGDNPFVSGLKELVANLKELKKSSETLVAQRDDLLSKLIALKEKIDTSQVAITDEDGLIHQFTGCRAGTKIALVVLPDGYK